MKLSDFNYNLPKELIAQQPAKPRDHSRLLVIDRQKKKIKHQYFFDIIDYLKAGDVLVLNNTKVFPARLIGKRRETGGKVEIFLLKNLQPPTSNSQTTLNSQPSSRGEFWEVLIGNRRKKVGQIIEFGEGLKGEIIRQVDESVWEVKFNKSGGQLEKLIDELGQVPVPPYIKIKGLRSRTKRLKSEYQTVYAEHRGSVAGPTAGFHFTKSLINKLKKKGIQFEFVTLHVGFGTFEPVKIQDITRHRMHTEFSVLDSKTARRLNQAKMEGRKVIAVGTTTVRTLETFSQKSSSSLSLPVGRQVPTGRQVYRTKPQQKWIDTFIYPGYKFKFVEAMVTNFHLPESTLLMLVSAFAGRQFILKAYQMAVKKKYRFYSFGDAMLII